MKKNYRNYAILLAIIILIVIIYVAYSYLYNTNTHQLGSQESPYNPQSGYEGPGYYLINGQDQYISSSAQLANATSSVQSTTINSTTSSVAATSIPATSASTSLPTTSLQTSSSSTSTSISSSTTAGFIGGGQCVSGCSPPSTSTTTTTIAPISASLIASNSVVNQLNYESLNASWSGGVSPYSVNFLVVNSINGNVLATALYSGLLSTQNSLTFQVPFSINALGAATVNVIVSSSGSPNATGSNTISINPATVTYSYNGLTQTGTSVSMDLIPSGEIYFCGATGYQGSLGPSWTVDESPNTWTSIGHQSVSNVCSVTQFSSAPFYIAGVGVNNALTYGTLTGTVSSSVNSYGFSYNSLGTDQDTFIIVSEVTGYDPVIGVSPSSGTCNTIEDQTSSIGQMGYTAIEACSGQAAATYTVSVTSTGGSDSAGWAVYPVT